MANTTIVEYPKATEKLSYRFILDSLEEANVEIESESIDPTQIKPLVLTPGKKYFRIGDVSELIGVEPYVLRYWENEFPIVKPVKSGSGHRVYSRKDVEALHIIRHLLHEEKFSIKGAKKRLLEMKKENREVIQKEAPNHKLMKDFIHQLKELITLAKTDI